MRIDKYIIGGGIVVIVAGILGYIVYKRRVREQTIDRFSGSGNDKNVCIIGCNKDCVKACSKSSDVHSTKSQYNVGFGNVILEKCVNICENNVAACKKKCNGCAACV